MLSAVPLGHLSSRRGGRRRGGRGGGGREILRGDIKRREGKERDMQEVKSIKVLKYRRAYRVGAILLYYLLCCRIIFLAGE